MALKNNLITWINVSLITTLLISLTSTQKFEGDVGSLKIVSASQKLFDEYFTWKLKNSPETATYIGNQEYNEFLSDKSESGYQTRYKDTLKFISRAERLLKETVDKKELLNLRVLKDSLQQIVRAMEMKGRYLQINTMYGMHRRILRIFKAMPLNELKDYETMLKRMAKVPTQVQQIIDLMKTGVQLGIVYSNYSTHDFNSSISKFIVHNATKSGFYKFFVKNFPTTITNQKKQDLKQRCADIITDKITPIFKELGEYMVNVYKPRTNIAVSSITNGTFYYEHKARYYTSTDLSPRQIHDIGLKEIDRIEGEMKKIVIELGYHNLTVKEFSEMIKKDSNNYHKTGEELLAEFRRLCYDVIPPKLTTLFKDVNNTLAFSIEGDPSPHKSAASYSGPSFDGSRPGTFFVPTANLRPKYGMLTLSLHETNPGHHLHHVYMGSIPDLPQFRRFRGSHLTFFSEGWALYAEKLGFDMDLYGNPLDRYGHLSAEVFRAARLVVDTGIHALGWTRDQAIDFMFIHTTMSRIVVEKEINRYITKPGQALSYKMGELKIRELRKKAQNKLGAAFDIKQFHETTLSSYGGTMKFLEELIDNWINGITSNKT